MNFKKFLNATFFIEDLWRLLLDSTTGQCFTIVDSKVVSIEKIIETLTDFGKNHGQKLLMPEVRKLAKLLLFKLATNSKTKHIKTFLETTQLGKGETAISYPM